MIFLEYFKSNFVSLDLNYANEIIKFIILNPFFIIMAENYENNIIIYNWDLLKPALMMP